MKLKLTLSRLENLLLTAWPAWMFEYTFPS